MSKDIKKLNDSEPENDSGGSESADFEEGGGEADPGFSVETQGLNNIGDYTPSITGRPDFH